MVRKPPTVESGPPEDFPQVPPRELYPVSDIRFVMVELGKLGTKVDRLLDDVKSHGDKIDALRHQVTFVKGAIWVIGGVVAILGVALVWIFSGKLSITVLPGK